jgi:hypothetical protein
MNCCRATFGNDSGVACFTTFEVDRRTGHAHSSHARTVAWRGCKLSESSSTGRHHRVALAHGGALAPSRLEACRPTVAYDVARVAD